MCLQTVRGQCVLDTQPIRLYIGHNLDIGHSLYIDLYIGHISVDAIIPRFTLGDRLKLQLLARVAKSVPTALNNFDSLVFFNGCGIIFSFNNTPFSPMLYLWGILKKSRLLLKQYCF